MAGLPKTHSTHKTHNMTAAPRVPFPFQLQGINFLVRGGTLLADQPGLGKTFQGITAARQLESNHPLMVFCPAIAVGVWIAEYKLANPRAMVLWLTALNCHLIEGPWDAIVVSVDLPARNRQVAEAIRKRRYDVAVIDEARYVNDPTALRTQTVLTGSHALAKRAARLIMLDGTPMPRHPGQLWTLISATAPERIGNMPKAAFEERYCLWKMMRLGNQPPRRMPYKASPWAAQELGKRLAMGEVPWWKRRLRKDVLDQVPKRLSRSVPIDSDDLADYKAFLSTKEGIAVAQAILERNFRKLRDPELNLNLARMRRIIGLAKARAAADYVQHVMHDEDPRAVLVWAWHPEVLDRIETFFPKGYCIKITGATPIAARQAKAERFEDRSGPRLALLQIKAAGSALTLNKADRSIFVERSWIPIDNEQAEDRNDRIGQDADFLQYETMYLTGSLDEAIEAVNEMRIEDWQKLQETIPD